MSFTRTDPVKRSYEGEPIPRQEEASPASETREEGLSLPSAGTTLPEGDTKMEEEAAAAPPAGGPTEMEVEPGPPSLASA
eukprot:3023309-Lingulodinium_polyedra.AAC.1